MSKPYTPRPFAVLDSFKDQLEEDYYQDILERVGEVIPMFDNLGITSMYLDDSDPEHPQVVVNGQHFDDDKTHLLDHTASLLDFTTLEARYALACKLSPGLAGAAEYRIHAMIFASIYEEKKFDELEPGLLDSLFDIMLHAEALMKISEGCNKKPFITH